MVSLLKFFSGLTNLLRLALSFWRDEKLRQEGRQEAELEATRAENEALNKAQAVDNYVRSRNKRDLLDRL